MLNLLPIEDAAPIVTFYSYKGGVGRSMAVLNVAALLASRGFRILIVDFDLEAPGLSHLFEKSNPTKKAKGDTKSESTSGVIELLLDVRERQQDSDLFNLSPEALAAKYTFNYPIPSGLSPAEEARLSIMPSGRLSESYATRLDQLNLPHLYDKTADAPPDSMSAGQKFILAFKTIITRSGHYDYILIDSRTGHSDEAGICTRDLADHRMVVSGLNHQNICGTTNFLSELRATFKAANIPILTPDIILSPVPNSEDDLVSTRFDKAKGEFKKAWGEDISLDLQIPYHPRLALTEEAYVPTLTASPLRAAYLEIEKRLLQSLGHQFGLLQARFIECIQKKSGVAALNTLQRILKLSYLPLDGGSLAIPNSLSTSFLKIDKLLRKLAELPQALDILELLASSRDGGYLTFQIAQRLHLENLNIAAAFDEYLLHCEGLDPSGLGDYAVFLDNNSEAPDAVETFYKRALEIDPNHAINLGRYANFLKNIGEDYDSAEICFKRAIDADPNNAFILGSYANFLTGIRKDHDAAEVYYNRTLDADPNSVNNLGNYANFLTDIRRDHDAAEALYKRNLDADPQHANNLGNYANFLNRIRKDNDAAEVFHKRALDIAPKSAAKLGNFGQFLTGSGRAEEGIRFLHSAWGNRSGCSLADNAELAYSLWLGTCLVGQQEPAWESVFKHFIELGFIRPFWNFDAMLGVAERKLPPADFKYAKALAAAFLDEAAVPALEKFPRWKKLKPLNPALVNPDGSIPKQI